VCNGYVKSGGVRLSMRAARPGSAPGEWVTLAYGCRGRTVISFCLSCWRRSRSKAKPSQFVRIGRLKESRWQSKVRGWVGEEKKKKTRIQRRPARGGLVFFVPWVGRRGKERRHCTLSAVAAEQEGKVGEGNLQTCLLSRLCWRASHLNLLRSCMCMI
jgi:hypothetical protein